MPRFVAAAVALACLLGAVPTASAMFRSGTAFDPQDEQPRRDGVITPDVEQLRVYYDSAGTVQATLRFYRPLTEVDPGFVAGVQVAARRYPYGDNDRCRSWLFPDPGDTYLMARVLPSGGVAYFSVAEVEGVSEATWRLSSDSRELTITATRPLALRDRVYTCASAAIAQLFSSDPAVPLCPVHCRLRFTERDTVPAFDLQGAEGPKPQGPEVPAPPPPEDTTAPRIEVIEIAKVIARRRMKVVASCSEYPCHVSATGLLSPRGRKWRFPLVRRKLETMFSSLQVAVPRGAAKAVRRELSAGRRPLVTIVLRAEDAAGNASPQASRKVRINSIR